MEDYRKHNCEDDYMLGGTHQFELDERNQNIQININGTLYPRAEARVSVFDSGFLLGDGVWEGLRVHQGVLAFETEHMDRLYAGAKAIGIDIGLTRESLVREITRTLEANGMSSGIHIRLIVSRGLKITPDQHPGANVGGPTVVIIPEYKKAVTRRLDDGLKLLTVHVHRGAPDVQDPRLNSLSKLNCVIACIQAANAGYDEALMLDPNGFVSTCNSTNFFIVTKGEVWTSAGEYCMQGITRGNVIRICEANNITAREKNFSLIDVYSADEVFVTGTFGGLIPVSEVDGRPIEDRTQANMISRLQGLYEQLIISECS